MAKRKKRAPEEERELTRKESRLQARAREHNRRLYIGAGSAILLAMIVLIAGALYAFAYVPNSTLAQVGNDAIVTKDFWQRMRLERSRLMGQLVNLQQLEQQFGQSFFTQQINQIQAQLQSPFALGRQVLDQMIDEKVVAQEATTRGITVSEEEIDAALREEIARNRNAITAPQATETAEAGIAATATATEWTPTPTPTIDANLVVTATATTVPTAEPLPTQAIISDTGYTEGLNELEDTLGEMNSVDLAGYREVIRARLLADKLSAVIGEEKVAATEEQVHARHILINVVTPTVSISDTGVITAPIAPTTSASGTLTASDVISGAVATGNALTTTAALTATAAQTATVPTTPTAAVTATTVITPAQPVTTSVALSATTAPTGATAVSGTATVSATAGLSGTTALTDSAAISGTAAVSDTVTPPAPVERTDAEAKALAESIRQQLLAGGDFAALAKEYSSDGSSAEGGDLGWFGRSRMVAPFAETAFTLPVGEISEPVKTQFGYHIIEVLEKDAARPKEASQLEQERRQAFDDWLQEKKTTIEIEQPTDLNARLPRDLR